MLLFARAGAGRPDVLSAGEALELGTLGSARALGLDLEVGSLVPGKHADIAIVELGQLHSAPRYHYAPDAIYSHLVYSARATDVPPRSTLTTSAPPSLTSRTAFRTASSSEAS